MVDRDLQNALNKIRQELNEKVGQRDLLNMQIMHLEQTFKSLRRVVFQNKITSLREGRRLVIGISEAIRSVMRTEQEPMTAAEVKKRLTISGFDLARFKNPAAVIHNTLARMTLAGTLKVDRNTKHYRIPNIDEST